MFCGEPGGALVADEDGGGVADMDEFDGFLVGEEASGSEGCSKPGGVEFEAPCGDLLMDGLDEGEKRLIGLGGEGLIEQLEGEAAGLIAGGETAQAIGYGEDPCGRIEQIAILVGGADGAALGEGKSILKHGEDDGGTAGKEQCESGGRRGLFRLGDALESRMGKDLEEEGAVGFPEEAGIKDNEAALVGLGADEAATALAEFGEGGGEGELVERVASLGAAAFGAGFGDRVGRVFERDAGDDDLGEGLAGDINACPEGIGAEEDGIAGLAHAVQEGLAGAALLLAEEGAAEEAARFEQAGVDRFEVAVAGKEDEGAAGGLGDEAGDLFCEEIGIEAFVAVGRFGGVGVDEDFGLKRVIERGGDDLGGGVGSADACLKGIHGGTLGEGGAGEEDAGFALEEGVAERFGDAEGSGAQVDDILLASGEFEPVNGIGIAGLEDLIDALAIGL